MIKKLAFVFLAAASIASSTAHANDRRLNTLLQNFGATELQQSPAAELQLVEPTDEPSSEHSTHWKGAAVSPKGRLFSLFRSKEVKARDEINYVCEQAAGSSCQAIAVPDWWDIGVVECTGHGQRRVAFVGGSAKGKEVNVALGKAVAAGFAPGNCRVHRYYDVAEAR
jgi:hypothetical protein